MARKQAILSTYQHFISLKKSLFSFHFEFLRSTMLLSIFPVLYTSEQKLMISTALIARRDISRRISKIYTIKTIVLNAD